ncbi:hypothetical protein VK792_00985 [Mesobacterium sp. TK19101]|uniref:Uncharacterized protein n=1 Tax=Mesobacterium hydrothermale TaxID=3111907 RepID=A0ABU6HBK7_9RHOB|nr:hypothetical protein [Mesobacterium sp. TK19101]MEC3859844.1 hypothetical protein [Mesobacterium sp. TK19101]
MTQALITFYSLTAAAFAAIALANPALREQMIAGIGVYDANDSRILTRICTLCRMLISAVMMAAAVYIGVIALIALAEGTYWAVYVVASLGVIVGGGVTSAGFRAERVSGMRTPWRAALALTTMLPLSVIVATA